MKFVLLCFFVPSLFSATLIDTGAPDNLVAFLSGSFLGIPYTSYRTADDFVLTTDTVITGGEFIGLKILPVGPYPIADVVVSFYDVFASSATGPYLVPGSLLATSSAVAGELTYTNRSLGVITVPEGTSLPSSGSGPVGPGLEMVIDFRLQQAIMLPAGRYFFSPAMITVSNPPPPSGEDFPSGHFYWLSAAWPAKGQATVDEPVAFLGNADVGPPSWVSTSFVFGSHNASFSLTGEQVPEPSTISLVMGGAIVLTLRRVRANSAIVR